METKLNYLDRYKLIIIILKKGLASKLIVKLKKIGVEGYTVMFGKGTAEKRIYEQIIGVEYEPGKEIIFIAMEESKVDKILDFIIKEEKINKPGHGIAIVLNLSKCAGIARLLNIELLEGR